MTLSKIICICVLTFCFLSCKQKKFDSKQELLEYIQNPVNEYQQSKDVNGVTYILSYRPTDLMVDQETNEYSDINQIDSLRKKYKQYLYFNLSLSKNDKEILSNVTSSREDFGAMVNQLAFGMGNKVHVYSQKKDTVALLDYIYPRVYGMGGATSLLFVYPRDEKILEGEFFHFAIEDIGLSTGEIRFKVPVKILLDEPNLNFNQL